MAHIGPCMKIAAETNCPGNCPEEAKSDVPVCGSDGNVYRYFLLYLIEFFSHSFEQKTCQIESYFIFFTYRSKCEMRRRTCGQHVIPVPYHHCAATEGCQVRCERKVQSVCGSDNKIYRNLCEMRNNNCG